MMLDFESTLGFGGCWLLLQQDLSEVISWTIPKLSEFISHRSVRFIKPGKGH